ncbi:hypothetical protein [Neobacillus sp. YIM B06451]|uniref:hypothetical protein n=1 Tax=Neobacillus sp. YIM B06451 TaxID=3070994 RepID=UPI00292DE47D|nr:hypothetical protein [Neobacillus sp. YIM B06451]
MGKVSTRRLTVFIVTLFIISISNIAFMTLPYFEPIRKDVAIWSFFDLAVCLPILFYFLIIRKNFKVYTVVPFAIACFWFAYLIVPKEDLAGLDYLKNGLLLAEAALIGFEIFLAAFLITKVPKLINQYKKEKQVSNQFLINLQKAITKTMGERKTLILFATEVSVFYYGLFSWKNKHKENETAFSYHKDSGYFGEFIMLAHALTIEIIGVHFMMLKISHILAWAVTALDVYILLILIADYKAIVQSPLMLTKTSIKIQKGLRATMEIDYNNIDSIEVNRSTKEDRKKEKRAYSMELGSMMEDKVPYVMNFKEEITMRGLYGKKRTIEKVYISVDEPEKFMKCIIDLKKEQEEEMYMPETIVPKL